MRELANDLGSIIGGSAACGFHLKEEAVIAFIDDRVEASDMGFVSSLDAWSQIGRERADDWVGINRVAQCRAVENTAREYGFID